MDKLLDDNAPRAGVFLFHVEGYVVVVQKPRSPKYGFMLDGKMRVGEVITTLSQKEVFDCSRARTLTQILAEHRQKYHTRALSEHEVEAILRTCQSRLLDVDQPFPQLKFEIPKGGAIGDESRERTAVRETLEELPCLRPYLDDRRLERIRSTRQETVFATFTDLPFTSSELPCGSDELSRALWAKINITRPGSKDNHYSFPRSCGSESFGFTLTDPKDGSVIEMKPRWINDLIASFDYILSRNFFTVPLIPPLPLSSATSSFHPSHHHLMHQQ